MKLSTNQRRPPPPRQLPHNEAALTTTITTTGRHRQSDGLSLSHTWSTASTVATNRKWLAGTSGALYWPASLASRSRARVALTVHYPTGNSRGL